MLNSISISRLLGRVSTGGWPGCLRFVELAVEASADKRERIGHDISVSSVNDSAVAAVEITCSFVPNPIACVGPVRCGALNLDIVNP